jgi:hypothetical protein
MLLINYLVLSIDIIPNIVNTDNNDDKQITIGELGNYVEQNVSEMAGMLDREQNPTLSTMNKKQVLIQY